MPGTRFSWFLNCEVIRKMWFLFCCFILEWFRGISMPKCQNVYTMFTWSNLFILPFLHISINNETARCLHKLIGKTFSLKGFYLVLLTCPEYLDSHQALQTTALKPFPLALYWNSLSEEQGFFSCPFLNSRLQPGDTLQLYPNGIYGAESY